MFEPIEQKYEGVVWCQGKFIDSTKYSMIPLDTKERWDYEEKFLVRPSPKGNAICVATTHEDAEWLVLQLNKVNEQDKLILKLTDTIRALRNE